MCDFGVSSVLVYYTHVPVFILGLLIGFFVLFANRKNAVNRNLFLFILVYSFWVANDFLQWIITDPRIILVSSQVSILGLGTFAYLLFCAY